MKRPRKQTGLTGRARVLRRNSTPGERGLWNALLEVQKSTGIRFHRQKPIGLYIADFYCPACKFIIEIDGISHESREKEDKHRDEYMAQIGLRVLRFTESDVQTDCKLIAENILLFMRNLSE